MTSADVARLIAEVRERLDRIERHLAVSSTPGQTPPALPPPPPPVFDLRDKLAAVDPRHPLHRDPIWSVGDVARFCRWVSGRKVYAWVKDGLIVPTRVTGETRKRAWFAPVDVLPQLEALWRPKARPNA